MIQDASRDTGPAGATEPDVAQPAIPGLPVPGILKGFRRETSILPESSIEGRALVIIIAIMTFLAAMTAGTVELISSASESWRGDISREVTIQVRPRAGFGLETEVAKAAALARKTAGVGEVRVYTKAESQKLLEPWLGVGLDLADIPVPRLIVLKVAGVPDFTILRQQLAAEVVGATLDDHRLWISRLSAMANSLVFVGFVLLGLVLTATALAVAFATRGAMAGTREIIEVIHLVGATDGFVAGEFQRHFLKLGLRGGAVGACMAIASFTLAGSISSQWSATPGGDQLEALFGSFTLGWRGFAAVIFIACLVALITTIVSRMTVFRNLRGVE
jgi:cell division transport system permease protein